MGNIISNKELRGQIPLGKCLSMVTKTYVGALSKMLEHLEIDRHFSILIIIENAPGTCTQKYVADLLGIDKVTMVRIMDYLVEKKLIKRSASPDDRRSYNLCLTDKSRKILPEIHKTIEEVNSIALAGLSKAEVQFFYENLNSINKKLEELPSNKVFINLKKSRRK